ncbi:hypothetical protein GCM10011415_35080 [Salipiger pallidus]|uniref:Uncharacterized protein n=1 Tax=Salipiger pallidus TaxID=1775170 RepID=A0A8J3EI22_9RHOB|nr:hypothetical protein GCM10011415_35080 [Salipiger pallidus]
MPVHMFQNPGRRILMSPAAEGGGGSVPRTGISLTVNGERRDLTADNRVTLLDALREELGLTGAK